MTLVNSISAYGHPEGNKYLHRVNKALGMINEERSMLRLSQMRSDGLIVDDCTRYFESESIRIRHYIVCPRSGIEPTLALSDVISYIPVWTHIQEELLFRFSFLDIL